MPKMTKEIGKKVFYRMNEVKYFHFPKISHFSADKIWGYKEAKLVYFRKK